MDITLKLKKLAEAALLLNGCGAVWGLGGSAMLYLRGAAADFHDLDILVREEDAAAARSALDCAFDRLPARPNPGYATKYFYEYTSEDVDLDFIAGFSIKKNGENHPCPFDSHHVDGAVSIFGETVPLQSVCDWRQYYSLMGREEKAATLCFFSPRTRMITVRPLKESELAAATDFAFPLYGDSADIAPAIRFCVSEVQAACPDTNPLVYLADSDDKDYIYAAKRCGFLENDRYLYFEKQ